MRINADVVKQVMEITKAKIARWSAIFPMLQFDDMGRAKFNSVSILDDTAINDYIYRNGMDYDFKEAFDDYLDSKNYNLKDRYSNYNSCCPRNIRSLAESDFIENYFHLQDRNTRREFKIKASRVLSAVHEIWAKNNPVYSKICEEIKRLRKEGKTYEDYDVQTLTFEKTTLEYGNVFVAQQKMQNECNGSTGVYITVNPLDLLSSSGCDGENPTQFSSCWSIWMEYDIQRDNLNAERGGCYSGVESMIALGSIINRGMLYIPNGKTLKVSSDTNYEILGYRERTHVWENNGKLLLEVIYPSRTDTRRKQLQDMLKASNIEIIDDEIFNNDMYNYIPFDVQDKDGIENYLKVSSSTYKLFLDRVCIDRENNNLLKMMPQPRCSYNYHNSDDIPQNNNTGRRCSCCGEDLDDDDEYYTLPNGDIICEGCRDENYMICDDCGDLIYRADGRWIDDDRWVCDSCIDNHYTRCDHCGEYALTDDIRLVTDRDGNEESWCDYCYDEYSITCEECGTHFTNDECLEEHCGRMLCGDCVDNESIECPECGCVQYQGDMVQWGDEGMYYCTDCAEKLDNEDIAVNI